MNDGDIAQDVTQTVARDAATVQTIVDLRDHVTRLIAQADQLERSAAVARDALNIRTRQHAEDIALIGERLLSEAGDRSWCEQYDEVVRELNNELHVELPVRESDYSVTVNVAVTISVSARDEAAAVKAVEEAVRDIEYTIDNGTWDGHSATANPNWYNAEAEQD